jgi:hypothetical protein
LAFKDCLRKRAEGRIGTSRHATTAGGGTAFATLRAALLGSGGQHGALWVSKEQQSEGYPVCSFQVITSSWGRWEIFEQLLHGFVEGLLLLFLCADLRVELLAPALVHWSADNWKTFVDVNTMDSGLGLHYVICLRINCRLAEKLSSRSFGPMPANGKKRIGKSPSYPGA